MTHNLGIKLYKFLLQGRGFLIAQNTIAVVVVELLRSIGTTERKTQLQSTEIVAAVPFP